MGQCFPDTTRLSVINTLHRAGCCRLSSLRWKGTAEKARHGKRPSPHFNSAPDFRQDGALLHTPAAIWRAHASLLVP